MLKKVFVVGRPGSGKTTAANVIGAYAQNEGFKVQRFKDYEILYNMFQEDIKQVYPDNKHRKFRHAEYGGFDVLDHAMFDEALIRLKKSIVASSEENELITIEFARDDYHKALSLFSPDFLNNAHLLFVDCSLERCIHRIYERMSNPPKPDFHFVSEYIMQTYYGNENWDYMNNQLKRNFPSLKEVVAIKNTNLSLDAFKEKVKLFAKMVVHKDFSKESLSQNESLLKHASPGVQMPPFTHSPVVEIEQKEVVFST